MERMIDDSVKQKLLDSLAEEPTMVLSTAYAYAKNYVKYGEDITKAWTTAVQQASVIQEVRQKAWVEAYDSFKKDYENRLKADNDCYWNENTVSVYSKNEYKSEDCIKREEVCKYVHEFGNNEYSSDEERELLELIVDGIRHLPSACPVDNGKDNNVTTKTGHWVYNNALFDSWTCSCCKCDSDKYTDYCPHCGAFMNEDVIEKQKGENT